VQYQPEIYFFIHSLKHMPKTHFSALVRKLEVICKRVALSLTTEQQLARGFINRPIT